MSRLFCIPAAAAAVLSLACRADAAGKRAAAVLSTSGRATPLAAAARAFVACLRAPAGRAVLKQWTFLIDADTDAAAR